MSQPASPSSPPPQVVYVAAPAPAPAPTPLFGVPGKTREIWVHIVKWAAFALNILLALGLLFNLFAMFVHTFDILTLLVFFLSVLSHGFGAYATYSENFISLIIHCVIAAIFFFSLMGLILYAKWSSYGYYRYAYFYSNFGSLVPLLFLQCVELGCAGTLVYIVSQGM